MNEKNDRITYDDNLRFELTRCRRESTYAFGNTG
jgi:hypothetical protein